jgi:hypothetical protein
MTQELPGKGQEEGWLSADYVYESDDADGECGVHDWGNVGQCCV